MKCNFKVLKYSKLFVISEYIEAFPKRTKMHSGGAHIEYYTPSELLFSVKTNVSFPHKFSHSWKKNWEKFRHFFHVKNLMKFSIFWKKNPIFLNHKIGRKKKKKKEKKKTIVTMLQPTRKKKLNYIPTWSSPPPQSLTSMLLFPLSFHSIFIIIMKFFSLWVCWNLGSYVWPVHTVFFSKRRKNSSLRADHAGCLKFG